MPKKDKRKRNFIMIASLIVIAVLFIAKIFFVCFPLSDSILAFTAIIVLWYTVETNMIRVANQELLHKSKRPAVGFNLFPNPKNQFDVRFQLINQSDYPVAVRVKITFKIDDEIIPEIWPAYNGKGYWNLQFQQSVEGHFDIIRIFAKSRLFEGVDINKIQGMSKEDKKREITKETRFRNQLEADPILTATVEVFSINDKGGVFD